MTFLLKHPMAGVLGRDRLAEGRARQRPRDRTKLGPGRLARRAEGEELQEARPQLLVHPDLGSPNIRARVLWPQ